MLRSNINGKEKSMVANKIQESNHSVNHIINNSDKVEPRSEFSDAVALVKQRTAGFNCTYITKNIVWGLGADSITKYHLVLCGGIFDYLDNKVARLVLRQIKRNYTLRGNSFSPILQRGIRFEFRWNI